MSDPISEYFKYAAKARVRVKAHTRKNADGTTSEVDAYVREEDQPESDPDDVFVDGERPAKEAPVVDLRESLQEELTEAEPTPEEAAILAELDSLASKKEREIAMWRRWKQGGQRPEDLAPLLESFAPLIRSRMSTHLGRVRLIPDAAIKAEYQIQFVQALRSFNPDRGVSLGTYVYRYLDKAKRFVADNQNVGRIPENRIYKIKQFQLAKLDLTDELDRPPTNAEVAKKLGWAENEVTRMADELRNDLITQGFEEDPNTFMPSRSEETLRLFKYELEGTERDVYEYLTGYGKPRLTSTGDIAKKVGIPDYQVSRVKTSIQKKLSRYVQHGE